MEACTHRHIYIIFSKNLELLATLACDEARTTSPAYGRHEKSNPFPLDSRSSSKQSEGAYTPYPSPPPPFWEDFPDADEFYAAYIDQYNRSPPINPFVRLKLLLLLHCYLANIFNSMQRKNKINQSPIQTTSTSQSRFLPFSMEYFQLYYHL